MQGIIRMESPTSTSADQVEISSRIVRYLDLKPCLNAFIDARSPGSDKKENFTIIGPGVSENPAQHVHIAEAHGFNIGGERQPPGCRNSQHSHETVEVFYVHSGTWRFVAGERGEDAKADLRPGDLISIPPHIFRGFENIGREAGFLWAVLGGDDPGHVLWAPYVFELAREYGLLLLENGQLIDTTKGGKLPPGGRLMQPTTPQKVKALRRLDDKTLESCIVRSDASCEAGRFSALPGIRERRLIGLAPLDWSHGFTVSELSLCPGAFVPEHELAVPDVWFVQQGVLQLQLGRTTATVGRGDTITVPRGMVRSLTNVGGSAASVVLVRGGDDLPSLKCT